VGVADVWRRFTESQRCIGHSGGVAPGETGDLFVQRDSWPDENEKDEASLRRALKAVEAVVRPKPGGCNRVGQATRAAAGLGVARMG